MPVIRDGVGHELTVDADALPYYPGYTVVDEDEKPAEKPKSVPAEKTKE